MNIILCFKQDAPFVEYLYNTIPYHIIQALPMPSERLIYEYHQIHRLDRRDKGGELLCGLQHDKQAMCLCESSDNILFKPEVAEAFPDKQAANRHTIHAYYETDEVRFWNMEEILASTGKGILTPNFEQELQLYLKHHGPGDQNFPDRNMEITSPSPMRPAETNPTTNSLLMSFLKSILI